MNDLSLTGFGRLTPRYRALSAEWETQVRVLGSGCDGDHRQYRAAHENIERLNKELVSYECRYDARIGARLQKNLYARAVVANKLKDSLSGRRDVGLSLEEELFYASTQRLKRFRDMLGQAEESRGCLMMLAEAGRLDF